MCGLHGVVAMKKIFLPGPFGKLRADAGATKKPPAIPMLRELAVRR
jgi:hypothetical protein